MPQGTLPARYSGVPLCTKKLLLSNCEVLIQQVKLKFSSWSVRALSFAGRLLLIKTVIAGITNFWCSSSVLPKACIKRINSLCLPFLWKGNIESHHLARVSWDQVTKWYTMGLTHFHPWYISVLLSIYYIFYPIRYVFRFRSILE